MDVDMTDLISSEPNAKSFKTLICDSVGIAGHAFDYNKAKTLLEIYFSDRKSGSDGIVFPQTVGHAYKIEETAVNVLGDTMIRALETDYRCLEVVRSTCLDIEEMISMTMDMQKEIDTSSSSVKPKVIKKISKTMEAIKLSLTSLNDNMHDVNSAVTGLRKAFIKDISDGVAPPLIYSKNLRYGLSVPILCGTCGSKVDENNTSMPQKLIADFIYGQKRTAVMDIQRTGEEGEKDDSLYPTEDILPERKRKRRRKKL
jgi:hypothetical protein